MKYATRGDIRAEFDRDFNEAWPTASMIIEKSEEFCKWYEGWLARHELDETALIEAIWGESKAN